MKKNVLLCMIVLMSSFVTHATNYVVVSSAGVEDVNGVYLETGSNGYSPIYTKSPYTIEHLAGEVWIIGSRKPPPDNNLYEFTYYSRATGANLPPTSGWELEDDGINPVPTLTICLDWLHPSLTSAEIASSTSLIINGSISNTSLSDELVNYQFYYGTALDNLNQSTVIQNINVPAQSSVNVNAALAGLTVETMYYFKLVAATNQSSSKKILLSITIPTANLKLHLRSDLAVTSTSSAVSNWGDVSGCDNDATQATGGNQPTFISNVINGNPVLRFNGSTTKMFLPTPETLGIEENPYEMFIVAKSSSSDIQFLIAGSSIECFEYHLNGTSGAKFIPVNSTYFDVGVAGSYTDGNAHLFSARAS